MASVTCIDADALVSATARRLAELIARAIRRNGSAMVSLTGGSTPRALYETLGNPSQPWRAQIDWARVHLFWGDERHVPPDHPDSNFGMADAALIRHVPIPASHVHRMRGELADPHDAAREYEHGIRDVVFDVMLLGLGEDAHIASIFPGSPLLAGDGTTGRADRHGPLVTAIYAPHLSAWRITLTPAAILDAQAIVMLVAGEKKAAAVHAALDLPLDVTRYPAQLLREAGDRVEWFIDRAAGARLRAGPPA
jgi:6-phosphogluconolactonase